MEAVCVNDCLNDFYLIEAMAHEVKRNGREFLPSRLHFQEEVLSLKASIHKKIANLFSEYLYVAIAGELRHTWERCFCSYELADRLEQFGIRAGGPRISTQKAVKKDVEAKMKLLPLAIEIFGERWENGYGGRSWLKIAELLHDYLKGKLNDTVFVDCVFNIRHNGGLAFDKAGWLLYCCKVRLLDQLNRKRNAPTIDSLYKGLMLCHPYAGKEIELLLKRGEALGYWKIREGKSEKKKEVVSIPDTASVRS